MTTEKLTQNLKDQIAANDIIIFMKGTPEEPMCRFSQAAVKILIDSDREFAFVDVIANPDVRSTLPNIYSWPTFPQIFIKGELIGGCDILVEMNESGELEDLIKDIPIA